MKRLKRVGNSEGFKSLIDLVNQNKDATNWVVDKSNPVNTYAILKNLSDGSIKVIRTYDDLKAFVEKLNLNGGMNQYRNDEFTTLRMPQGMTMQQMFDVLIYGKDVVIDNKRYKPRFEVVGGPFKGQKMTIYDLWDKNIRWARVEKPDGTFYNNIEFQNRPNPQPTQQPAQQQSQNVETRPAIQPQRQEEQQTRVQNNQPQDSQLPNETRKERMERERQNVDQTQTNWWDKTKYWVQKRLDPKGRIEHPLARIPKEQFINSVASALLRVWRFYKEAEKHDDQKLQDQYFDIFNEAAKILAPKQKVIVDLNLNRNPNASPQEIYSKLEQILFLPPPKSNRWIYIDEALRKLQQVQPPNIPTKPQTDQNPLDTLFRRIRRR